MSKYKVEATIYGDHTKLVQKYLTGTSSYLVILCETYTNNLCYLCNDSYEGLLETISLLKEVSNRIQISDQISIHYE